MSKIFDVIFCNYLIVAEDEENSLICCWNGMSTFIIYSVIGDEYSALEAITIQDAYDIPWAKEQAQNIMKLLIKEQLENENGG